MYRFDIGEAATAMAVLAGLDHSEVIYLLLSGIEGGAAILDHVRLCHH
jgi:hypothetical protein